MPALAALAVFSISAHSQNYRLFINEVQVANIDMYLDPSLNYGAWIELYNAGSTTQSLIGVTVRHTAADGTVSQHKLNSTHGTIPSRSFRNLWFDHNSADGYYGSGASTQLRYKLSADGGMIELLESDGTLIDAVSYPPSIARTSWARTTDGGTQWGYTSQPTPAATNVTSQFAEQRTLPPTVNTDISVFDQPFSFSVDIPQGATLHYTTDGSTPVAGTSQESSTGWFNVDTTIVYRFLCTEDGKLNSPVVTHTFIRCDKAYYLPILSVTTHPDNLFDNTIGLYVRGTNGRVWNNSKTIANQNMDWERPVNVEYLVPNTEANVYKTMLNQGADFQIFGGWTRFNSGDTEWEHKSSFKLKANRLADGDNFFTAPVFDSKPYTKQKHLLVRNGGQDQYERFWDAALQEMLRTSGIYLDCQAYQPAHIFLDGQYLGMLNLREASNRKFAYSNYGIGDDEVDQWEDEFIIKAGDAQAFNRWSSLCAQLASNSTNPELWQEICDLLDVDEFCNYMAAETYIGNQDWVRTGLKNIKGFRSRNDDGKIHVVVYDLDGGFGDTNVLATTLSRSSKLCTIFRNMLKYAPFKKQFIDAYCIMGASVFVPDRCLPILQDIVDNIAPALAMEGLSNTTKRETLIQKLSDRNGYYLSAMRSLQTSMGVSNPYTLHLQANTQQARLKLNTQEIPTARFEGFAYSPITLTALTPAGYEFAGWQVDGEVVSRDSILDLSTIYPAGTYTVTAMYDSLETPSAQTAPVRINEVCATGDIYINEYLKKTDWIELYNTTSQPIDLAGMYLTDNPNKPQKYQIPAGPGTIIPPHGYRIVWCDGREPISQLHASFKLANADSSYVAIMAADGSWTDALQYDAQGRWQTFGRYPDGSDNVGLLDRITIEQTNHVLTSTVLVPQIQTGGMANDIRPLTIGRGTRIVAVDYYNTNGQKLSGPADARIVIQRITYDNGYSEVRKVIQRE